jgi:cellulose synthase/poly-beta-1,6-N-acetylglucosamine synthase-like glycosyltransferase
VLFWRRCLAHDRRLPLTPHEGIELMEFVFWGSVLLIVYPYALYPLLLMLWGSVRPRLVRRAEIEPAVTVLIPAYNEASVIGTTLGAMLAQDYPKHKLQILVVSDCSDDGTDDIVRTFADRGVELLRQELRGGKALGLNAAMRRARGDIAVFSDANSRFSPSAVRSLVKNFADPEVGYVTGALTLESGKATLSGGGIAAYMNYEEVLRAAETRVGSVIGVNGGCDAIRRALYSDIPRELITDFVLPLRVIASGYRVVFDPEARSTEQANAELRSEFGMRVRVALRALQGIVHMRRLLDPLRHPGVSFCLVSHKVLRYFAFVFLVSALLSNLALAASTPFYRAVLLLHLASYGLAACGMLGIGTRRLRWFTVAPAYLLMSYAAFAVATWRLLKGQTMATWKPRAG